VRKKAIKKNVLSGLPAPIAELDSDEQNMYARLCNHLLSVDALYDADAAVITFAAVNINQARQAIKALKAAGPIQEFENGTRNVSPEYSVFEKCNTMFKVHSQRLGLDPKSRQDIIAFIESGADEATDPAADALGGPSL